MVLMKGTNDALYNGLVMLVLDQLICKVQRPESKFVPRSRVRRQPFKRADFFCGVHRSIRSLPSDRC